MTFSYQPIGEQMAFSSPMRRIAQIEGTNDMSSPYKACIVNQVPKDERRNKSVIIENLQKYFMDMNISCIPVNSPPPSFFQTGLFDYDLIFLIGHGDYDGVNHWLYTGEEIFCSDDVNKIDNKTFAKLSKQADAFFKYLHPEESSNMVSNSWVCEKRNGVDVLVWYTKVSEHYIASAQRDFFGKNAAIFNVACQSLKESEGLAKTFLDKGAKCYLGYTETNNIGAEGGESFFKNLMTGLCGYGSKQQIPSEWCSQKWDNGTEPILVLLPSNEKKTKQYRITMSETLNADDLSSDNGINFQIQGRMRMQIFDNSSKYKYGFQYSTDSDMSQADSIKAEGKYDSSTLYMNWEATLDDNDLKPNTTYYYRAYMNDGYSDCYGEIKQFTTKDTEEDTSDYEAYGVFDGNTVTLYYDNKRKKRDGKILPKSDTDNSNISVPNSYSTYIEPNFYTTYIEKVIFDSSYAKFYPIRFRFLCEHLISIENIKYLNTSQMTDMGLMFSNCKSLTNLDLSSFNTSNVTDMSCMFYNCSSLKELDLSNFNTSNVTRMTQMFFGCESLTSLDLSSFNTSNVKNMDNIFSSCSSLKTIYANNWDNGEYRNAVLFPDNLVGGQGTKIGWNFYGYDENGKSLYYWCTNSRESAHIDGGKDNPGLFTAK